VNTVIAIDADINQRLGPALGLGERLPLMWSGA
jgi:hypothetical protein